LQETDLRFTTQNKPENEDHPFVRFPPSCRRSEGGDGRLKAAAAVIIVFVSVYCPKLGREQTVGFAPKRGKLEGIGPFFNVDI
jgi:hypothetical protein